MDGEIYSLVLHHIGCCSGLTNVFDSILPAREAIVLDLTSTGKEDEGEALKIYYKATNKQADCFCV